MKKTIKPYNRLRLGSDFAQVRNNGQKYVGRMMIMVMTRDPGNTLKCGVVCGRKFSKKAVVRNRVRRIVWEAFRLIKTEIEPCHMIIIPRKLIIDAKRQMVESEMKYLLKKAGQLIRQG